MSNTTLSKKKGFRREFIEFYRKIYLVPERDKEMGDVVQLVPFLKWPGGKRWLVSRYGYFFPRHFRRYIEPFLGGGSVYFYLQPNNSLLGDINQELINAYCAVRDNWKKIEKLLHFHQANHCNDYYYFMRESQPSDPIEKAARFIYLNRTCFNGVYRVNQDGKFNVPKGTKDSVVLGTDNFKEIAGRRNFNPRMECGPIGEKKSM